MAGLPFGGPKSSRITDKATAFDARLEIDLAALNRDGERMRAGVAFTSLAKRARTSSCDLLREGTTSVLIA
jgi:hypothetical protein